MAVGLYGGQREGAFLSVRKPWISLREKMSNLWALLKLSNLSVPTFVDVSNLQTFYLKFVKKIIVYNKQPKKIIIVGINLK